MISIIVQFVLALIVGIALGVAFFVVKVITGKLLDRIARDNREDFD